MKSDSNRNNSSRCPFGFGGSGDRDAAPPGDPEGPDYSGNQSPSDPSGNIWRPRSSRVGVSPTTYVYWNALYYVLQTFNRGLARDPNRKVSWDKWPTFLGLLYLMAKMRYLRSNALTDPYDYAAKETRIVRPLSEKAKIGYAADGTYVSDDEDPLMGASDTRFGSNIPPRKIRPDVENMRPSAREAGRLRWRHVDENGREIVVPAMILNDLAGGWIQFQFHNFGGNTKRDPVRQCPHLMRRETEENWPGGFARIDRNTKDPTRVTENGRPTIINENTVAWIQGQLYGDSDQELGVLRSFKEGKFLLDETLRLPEDPEKPGIDKTGFNHNYHPLLSLLHWLFVSEHNAIADHYAYFHPEWDDETLFQMARKVNVAQIARIHTVMWTEDLLQHPTLQEGMHADWYGFLGQKRKMSLMRLEYRRPFVSKLLKPLRSQDILWGMTGSNWEHHDAPYQVPLQFRMVYRLHELILSEHDILEPGSNRALDRFTLREFLAANTRPLVAKFGYETLAWSFVSKSCGALTLHNFPRYLTQFPNQQDGELTDLAERDIFRERTDGTGTYNEFRMSVGEPPVSSFLELTGGDAELARELSRVYEGDVDKVDAGIGILAEPKPAGFALGFCQFYQFVLNAPRRIKSNRHLTEGFRYKFYLEGMDWVEHGGGMLGVMSRHLPGLKPQMEGVTRAFAPWPETETFPLRQLQKTYTDTAKVFQADLKVSAFAALSAGLAIGTGAVAPVVALPLFGAVTIIPAALTVRRMLAMRFMRLCWKRCYTDKRSFMFGTLSRAEDSINSAARFGRLHAAAVVIGSAALAVSLAPAHALVSVPLALTALSGFAVRERSQAFADDAQVLKIALRNRMREGLPVVSAADVPGQTALDKRYLPLKGDNENPVANIGSMYRALRRTGLPVGKSLSSAILSALLFGPRSQRGMARSLKRRLAVRPLDIYLPNLISVQGRSNTRIYAASGNSKGICPGELDMAEFELMFRRYAPGRDYLTAYDFSRMHEGNCARDAEEGLGNVLSRFVGRLASRRRSQQLMLLYADRVVEEDRKLVPAISKDMLLRFYQGAAQYDLMREHEEGDTDPSPVTNLRVFGKMRDVELAGLYRMSASGDIPDGSSNGKALIMPASLPGRALSALANTVWKGKVFDRENGTLRNRILGLRIVKARVFKGTSWSDGKESVIIDYAGTSALAFLLRDEIREVHPGLYLGRAYVRLPFGLRFCALFFALDFRR